MKFSMIGVVAVLGLAGGATAQTEDLFVHSQGDGRMYVINGGSIVNQWQTDGNFSPIAASGGTVRANGFNAGYGGSEYQYNGTFVGANPGHSSDTIYDSTSDGTFNYAPAFSNTMYSTNPDFSNQQPIFGLGNFGQLPGGVAFDSSANTLWVSAWSGTNVREYDMAGNLTGRGFQAQDQLNMALAYERTTDTLWVVPRDTGTLILRQYSVTGTLLQTINLGNGGNFLSAEFGTSVPTPGAAALVGLGGLAAARRRR